MKQFRVKTYDETGGKYRTWRVSATTKDDAIQIAFALDRGWGKEQRNATDMLALAQMHCEVLKGPNAKP